MRNTVRFFVFKSAFIKNIFIFLIIIRIVNHTYEIIIVGYVNLYVIYMEGMKNKNSEVMWNYILK